MVHHGPPLSPADLQGGTGHDGALRKAGRRLLTAPQVQAGHGAARTTGLAGLECLLMAECVRSRAAAS